MRTADASKFPKELKSVYEHLAKQRQEKKQSQGIARLTVGMGTCGIAAGSRDTMRAILAFCEENKMNEVVVFTGGCIGCCEQEPIVQVQIGDSPCVIYGKVAPDVAQRILREHVCGGNVIQDHVIQVKRPR
jgi:NADP-reducing hydrogenase subunit HndB